MRRLATDWARACSKAKFKKVIMTADADAATEDDLKARTSIHTTTYSLDLKA